MKTFSSSKAEPVTWLACLLIALGALELTALGQAAPDPYKNPFADPENPLPYPPNFVPPKPPPSDKVDLRSAVQLLRQHVTKIEEKARKGDYKAIYNMGVVYTFGAGVPVDHELAFKHFLKSAEEAVYAPAMFNLAICYAAGNGTQIDLIRAHKWWNLAAAQGHPLAAKARDDIAKILKKSQIEAAARMTRGYREKLKHRIKLETLRIKQLKRFKPDLSDDAAYRLSQQFFLNRDKPNPTDGID